jgi:hypothetical protein
VRHAPFVALVRAMRAVFDERSSLAAPPTDPQFRVHLLERTRSKLRKPRERGIADRGLDELLDRHPVAGPSGLLDLMPDQPLIEQVAQRHAGARRGRLRDLPTELVPQLDRRVLVLG